MLALRARDARPKFRPDSAKFSPMWTKFGVTSAGCRPNLASAKFDQTWPEFDHTWPGIGEHRPVFDQRWLGSSKMAWVWRRGPRSRPSLDWFRPHFERYRPISTKLGLASTKSAPNLRTSFRARPNLDRVRPTWLQLALYFDQTWPGDDQRLAQHGRTRSRDRPESGRFWPN